MKLALLLFFKIVRYVFIVSSKYYTIALRHLVRIEIRRVSYLPFLVSYLPYILLPVFVADGKVYFIFNLYEFSFSDPAL